MAKSPLLPGETIGEYLNRISGSGTIIAASRKVRQRQKPRSRGFQHSQPTVTVADEPEKPDFDTALRAKRGDRAAQRKVNLWIKRQRAKEKQQRMVQALEDRALFGAAEGTIKGARKTVDPRAAALIEGLSPSTAIASAARGFRHGDVGPATLDLLGIIPAGRAPLATARAARVVRAAEKAARAEARAAERLAKAGFKHKPNTLQVGEKVQELPTSKSRVTRTVIEKPAGAVSGALQGEGRIARGVRRAEGTKFAPKPSAEGRVAKAMGRERRVESERALLVHKADVDALPKEGSAKDVAHFWWAQIPEAWRSDPALRVEALRRAKQLNERELAEIESGTRLKQLLARKAAIQGALRTAEGPEHWALREQLTSVQEQLTDLGPLREDLALSIQRLNKVIANPPALDQRVIDAVAGMSATRRGLLEEAGLLDPGRAVERENLLSRILGIEPGEGQAFVGHRLSKPRGANLSLTPSSMGVGRPRAPEGLQKNDGVLIRQGRARQSTHVAAQDWAAAENYRGALVDRDNLAAIGKPFEGRVPEGYVLINKKGTPVPKHMKTDMLAKYVAEGGSQEDIEREMRNVLSSFMANSGADAEKMVDEAIAAGMKTDDLRIVPEKLVKRYYSQFVPVKANAYDMAVDATMASLIFFRLGYIPKNAVQNAIMSIPHQGVFFFANAPRAAQALKNPRLRHLIAVEVGQGATSAVKQEAASRVLRAPAGAVTSVADLPFRASAWIHEAAKAEVISKTKPWLDATDVEALIQFAERPENRSLLNAAHHRVNDAMGDFTRMNPKQRRWARRFLIIPGWLVAGSRYPFHFAANYPGRSAAMAYVAAGEPGAPDELQVNKPVDEYLADWTPSWLQGIPTPWGFWRTGSVSPIATPVDLGRAILNKSPESAIDYTNPLLLGLIAAGARLKEAPGGGFERTSYGDALKHNLVDRLVPNYGYAKDMISPPSGKDKIYSDTSRWGRTKREIGIFPVDVNRLAAQRSKLYESGSKAEKARFNKEADYKALQEDIAAAGIKLTPKGRQVVKRAYFQSAELAAAMAGKKTNADKLRATIRLNGRLKILSPSGVRLLRRKIATLTEYELGHEVDKMQRLFGGAVIADISEKIARASTSRGLEPTQPRGIR